MSRTVILIDDDQDDLDVLIERIALVDATLRCISFRHPLEALRAMLQDLILLPDFIFTDINMPELRGDHLVSELRKNEEFDHTVITVLSTSIAPKNAELLRKLGANYVFEKPTHLKQYDAIFQQIFFNPESIQ
jgi:CheY-like chemotaxis protein